MKFTEEGAFQVKAFEVKTFDIHDKFILGIYNSLFFKKSRDKRKNEVCNGPTILLSWKEP